MKKLNGIWLIAVACVFLSGLVGFYIGRNCGRSPVEVTTLVSPTEKSAATAPSDSTDPTEFSGPVNINTADSAQLQTLPGIGPTLAQRIIDYRQANGPFESVYDLTLVSGIGLSKLENILDYITVGGEE